MNSTPTLEIPMMLHIAAGVVIVMLAACNQSGAAADAKQLAGVLSGDAKGSAAANPMCKLFSPAEASAYSGKKLQAGTNAAMGTGCQWAAGDGDGMTMIQAVPLNYANNPSGAPGYRKLPELGKGAYVAADMGGWIGGALQGKEFVGVVVTGPNASEKTAIALLNETLKRRQ
jgi:hypothetical protein